MDPYSYTPGQTVPGTQYRFVRVLGGGGHGTVCVVEHAFLEVPSVMKLLHAELATERDISQRMTREARTLAKLRHPNIVAVRDGGMTAESPPRPYFVMESLAGTTLRELVKSVGKGIGALPALQIMSAVLDGLHHAHSAGVIHRDIKPDNIFLSRAATEQTVPKILDFGIAHLLGGERLTGESVLGTPRYAAPEQLLGEPMNATADIYSAGLVLWELVTGRLPFAERRSFEALLRAHALENLPAPSSLTRDAGPEVDGVIAYLTDRDPARRPPTAFAAAAALREVQALLASREREPSDLEAAGFTTRPTPLANALREAGSASGTPIVETPPLAPTRPGPPPRPHLAAPEVTVPMTNRPSALLEAALQAARELPAPPAPAPVAPPPAPVAPPPRAPVPSSPSAAPPVSPVSSPPSAAPSTSVRALSLKERMAARPVLLFFVAFAIIAGIGVPLAVTVARRFVTAPALPVLRSPPP